MRNILIIAILLCFTIFVIIVIVFEKMKGQRSPATSEKKNSQLIDVSDLAHSEEFAAKVVGLSKDNSLGALVGLGNMGQENSSQPIPRVTGAVFGQGFEVSKIDNNFRSGNGSVFTSVRCS